MTVAPRILVVDDEVGLREGCRKILQAEGFEAETACDGLDGLERYDARRDYDAAVVDLKMPRMGGVELIEALRARDEDMVLLVMTAYATIETAVEATQRGADGYIPKPFTPGELLLPLRNMLEKRQLRIEARRLRQEREDRLLEVASERGKSRTILQCLSDGVIVANREGQVVMWNAAATQALPSISGAEPPIRTEALGCDALAEWLRDAAEGGDLPHVVTRELRVEAGTFLVTVSPVLEEGRGATGAVAILADITEMKKLETAKSMFVSMVAHEVKRPLGVIEGYLNILLSGAANVDETKKTDVLTRCRDRAKTLRVLVNELMNLSAMETGHFAIHRVPTDIAAVVRDALDACRERASERRIELDLDVEALAGSPPILADREALFSVFNNLIDNAVKYTPEGGRASVRGEGRAGEVVVAIRDTGIGMSAEEQTKIFEEFYRVSNKFTAKVPGTGLGLSLVKRLVALHQGSVRVSSEPGKGSTFTVVLPREPAERAEPIGAN